MTYQEIKDSLSKCERTLKLLQNGSTELSNTEVESKTAKLQILKESLTKQLNEASRKTAFIDGRAVDIEDKKDLDKFKDNNDIDSIETGDGKVVKENDGVKFSLEETKAIAKKVGKAVAMSLREVGDNVTSMKAKSIEENSFEIVVDYKGEGPGDEFSFYIKEDSLFLTDFSFNKELTDVGVKPSGEAIVNVDVLANELVKHFRSTNESEVEGDQDGDDEALSPEELANKHAGSPMKEAPEGMYYIKIPKDAASQNKAQVIFNDFHDINYEINDDPDGIFMYFKKEDFDAGVIDDLEGDGVQILDTNIPDINEDAEEDAKNDADYAQGWHDDPRQDEDTDVGHQDDEPDMLGASAMETAEYAAKLVKKLQRYDQHDGEVDFPNWWQKKLILARDYISAAYHYLDSEEKQPAIDQLALENKVNEGRGDGEAINNIIIDMANEDDISTREAAEEIIDHITHVFINTKGKEVGENLTYNEPKGIDKVAGGIPYRRHGNKVVISMDLPDDVKERLLDKAKKNGYFAQPNMSGGITITLKKGMYEEGSVVYMNHSAGKIQKAHGLVVAKMKELTKQYKAGDKSVVPQLKDLSAEKKKLEKALEKKVAGIGKNQSLGVDDTQLDERLDGNQQEALMDLQNILDRAAELGDEARSIIQDTFPEELRGAEAYDVFNFGSSSNSYDNTLESLISDIEQRFSEDEGDDLDEKKNIVFSDSAYDMVLHTMKRLAKKYKAGDKSVVKHLKKLTHIKKQLEKAKIAKAAKIGQDQELETDTELREAGPGFKHDCAAKVVHEKYGAGNTIPEKHTLVKEGGKYVVTHYDVLFENGNTVLDIPVNELKIETTNEHWHKGYKKKKK